ncbi:hypothetical protein Emed_006296 [Eimeria media]
MSGPQDEASTRPSMGSDPSGSTLKEGLVTVQAPKGESVFFNPAQVFNRDLSVLVLKAFAVRQQEVIQQRSAATAARCKAEGRVEPQALEFSGLNVLEPLAATAMTRQEQRQASSRRSTFGAAKKQQQQQQCRENTSCSSSSSSEATAAECVSGCLVSCHFPLRLKGLRSLRYLRELPGIVSAAVANDLDPEAAQQARANAALNKIEEGRFHATCAEGSRLMHLLSHPPLKASTWKKINSLPVGSTIPATFDLTCPPEELALLPPLFKAPSSSAVAAAATEAAAAAGAAAAGAAAGEGGKGDSGLPYWYDVVDVDPYGSCAPFLDAAVSAIRSGGLLCLTSTDMSTLVGNALETAFYKYGGAAAKSSAHHEVALRLVLHAAAQAAARQRRAIEPLLCLSVDFYVRLFLRVYDSPEHCKQLQQKTAMVFHCATCEAFSVAPLGSQAFKASRAKSTPPTQAEAHSTPVEQQQQQQKGEAEAQQKTDGCHEVNNAATNGTSSNSSSSGSSGAGGRTKYKAGCVPEGVGPQCAECGSRTVLIGGPLYSGRYYDPAFVDLCLSELARSKETLPGLSMQPRIMGMLTALREELPDVPLHYQLPSLCTRHKLSMVKPAAFKSALRRLGYKASHFHRDPQALKTEAPASVVFDLLRAHAKKHPPADPSKCLVLSKPIQTEGIDFSPFDPNKVKSPSKPQVARWLPNPAPYWGPKGRAGKKRVAETQAIPSQDKKAKELTVSENAMLHAPPQHAATHQQTDASCPSPPLQQQWEQQQQQQPEPSMNREPSPRSAPGNSPPASPVGVPRPPGDAAASPSSSSGSGVSAAGGEETAPGLPEGEGAGSPRAGNSCASPGAPPLTSHLPTEDTAEGVSLHPSGHESGEPCAAAPSAPAAAAAAANTAAAIEVSPDVVFAVDDLRVSLPRALLEGDRLKDTFLARLVALNEGLGGPPRGPQGPPADQRAALRPRRTASGALKLEAAEAEGFAALIAHLKGERPLHLCGPAHVLQALVQLLANCAYWCVSPAPVSLPLFFWCSEAWADELGGVYPIHPGEREALGPLLWKETKNNCLLRLQRLPYPPPTLRPYLEAVSPKAEDAASLRGLDGNGDPIQGEGPQRGAPTDGRGEAVSWQKHLKFWQEHGPAGGGPTAEVDAAALLQGAQEGAAVVAAVAAAAATAAAAASSRWFTTAGKLAGFGPSSRVSVDSSGVRTPRAAAASPTQSNAERERPRMLVPPHLQQHRPQQQQQQPQQQQQQQQPVRTSLIHPPLGLWGLVGSRASKGASSGSGGPSQEAEQAAAVVQKSQDDVGRGGPQRGAPAGSSASMPAAEYYSCPPFHLGIDRETGRLLVGVDGCRYPHVQYCEGLKQLLISKPIAFRVDELQWVLLLNASRYLQIHLSGLPWSALQKAKRDYALSGARAKETETLDSEEETTPQSLAAITAAAAASAPSGRGAASSDGDDSKRELQGKDLPTRCNGCLTHICCNEDGNLAAAAVSAADAAAAASGAALGLKGSGLRQMRQQVGHPRERGGRVVTAEEVSRAAACAAAALKRRPEETQRRLQQQVTSVPPQRILVCKLCCCSNFLGSHMVCVHPNGHVVVASWPLTNAVSRSSAFQSPLVAVSSGLFARALKEVQFYPWGIFALFADAPISRVFGSGGTAHGFSLVIGKAMVFGQTPRDLAEKKVVVYIKEQQQQPFAQPRKPPQLDSIHEVLRVCPFLPPEEVLDYKEKHQIPMREYHRMLRLAVSHAGQLVSVASEGDFTLGLGRDCCSSPQPLVETAEITSPVERIVSSGFPTPKGRLFSSQLIGFFSVQEGGQLKHTQQPLS